MTIKTNQPRVVMYTGNSLEKGWKLVEGESKQYGVCFKTQAHPAFLTLSIVPKCRIKSA